MDALNEHATNESLLQQNYKWTETKQVVYQSRQQNDEGDTGHLEVHQSLWSSSRYMVLCITSILSKEYIAGISRSKFWNRQQIITEARNIKNISQNKISM